MRWSVGPKAPDHSVVTAVSTLFGSICRFSTVLSFLRSSSASHQATVIQATPLRERLVSATAANKFRPHHRERRGQRGEGGSGGVAGAIGGEHRHDQDVGRPACPPCAHVITSEREVEIRQLPSPRLHHPCRAKDELGNLPGRIASLCRAIRTLSRAPARSYRSLQTILLWSTRSPHSHTGHTSARPSRGLNCPGGTQPNAGLGRYQAVGMRNILGCVDLNCFLPHSSDRSTRATAPAHGRSRLADKKFAVHHIRNASDALQS
jgi:hypothetical protein